MISSQSSYRKSCPGSSLNVERTGAPELSETENAVKPHIAMFGEILGATRHQLAVDSTAGPGSARTCSDAEFTPRAPVLSVPIRKCVSEVRIGARATVVYAADFPQD